MVLIVCGFHGYKNVILLRFNSEVFTLYSVKVTCYSSSGCSVKKYSFDSPSDALHFALTVHAEMTQAYEAGQLEFCAVAFICPEIGERGWED